MYEKRKIVGLAIGIVFMMVISSIIIIKSSEKMEADAVSKPDFIISYWDASTNGGNTVISYKIKNIGSLRYTGAIVTKCMLFNPGSNPPTYFTQYDTETVDLGASNGESGTLTATLATTSYSCSMGKVDSSNFGCLIPEEDETNNVENDNYIYLYIYGGQTINSDFCIKNPNDETDMFYHSTSSVPEGWTLTLSESSTELSPDESVYIGFDVTAPETIESDIEINIYTENSAGEYQDNLVYLIETSPPS